VKILLVVNPSASSVTARRQVIIRALLAADHDVDTVETNRRGHASKLALDAARSGTDVVVVLGGDGTLNEVANGIVGTDCALAALPGGSTNVFSRAIGLPDEPVDAAMVITEALAEGRIEPVGLGSVNGRYFLFHVGIGWDAALVEEVEKRSELKRYASHPLFIYAGLRTFFITYDRTKPHFTVTHPDGTTVEGAFDICLNLNPYTFVGTRPFNVAPEATLDRGLANICLSSMRALPFLGLIVNALRDGTGIRKSRHVDYRSDIDTVTIDGHGPVPYQVDGDYLGTIEHLELRHHPNAMRLVLPA
jgi:diacylglycerol kinase family enzyme